MESSINEAMIITDRLARANNFAKPAMEKNAAHVANASAKAKMEYLNKLLFIWF